MYTKFAHIVHNIFVLFANCYIAYNMIEYKQNKERSL